MKVSEDNTLYKEYTWIMEKEAQLGSYDYQDSLISDPEYIRNLTHRILEVAENSTVLRCGNLIGHLTVDNTAYESDGAHTNLVRAIANYVLDCIYGWGESTPDYTRREIDEAILLHDLPENIFGDIPDNRHRNEYAKQKAENDYFISFFELYAPYDKAYIHKIARILCEMGNKSSPEGRIVYLADKLAAIIMMLCYDSLDNPPCANHREKSMSHIDPKELALCELHHSYYGDDILLSELWTVDFLYGRGFTQYDDTGFFTALLVMATLIVHHQWYEWRTTQYLP